jgi:hypothetical protein
MTKQAPTCKTRTEEMTISSIEQELGLHHAQLAARRENAEKRTRLRTLAAKFHSSQNALDKIRLSLMSRKPAPLTTRPASRIAGPKSMVPGQKTAARPF